MPPAFALSQDQTLRFIQASPCNPSHTATPKRTSKGSSLSPITPQPTSNNQAPSHKTQNRYPKGTSAQAPTAHPTPPLIATRQNTQQKPSTQPFKNSQALSTSKKTRCNCQTTKKRTSNRTPHSAPLRRPPQPHQSLAGQKH